MERSPHLGRTPAVTTSGRRRTSPGLGRLWELIGKDKGRKKNDSHDHLTQRGLRPRSGSASPGSEQLVAEARDSARPPAVLEAWGAVLLSRFLDPRVVERWRDPSRKGGGSYAQRNERLMKTPNAGRQP